MTEHSRPPALVPHAPSTRVSKRQKIDTYCVLPVADNAELTWPPGAARQIVLCEPDKRRADAPQQRARRAPAAATAAATTAIVAAGASSPTARSSAVHVANNTADLDRLVAAYRGALVLFATARSQPCAAVAGLFAWLADEYAGSAGGPLALIRVDVDKGSEAHQRYGITEVPTFVVFERGQLGAVRVPSVARRPEASVRRVGGAQQPDGDLVERIYGSLETVALLEAVKAMRATAREGLDKAAEDVATSPFSSSRLNRSRFVGSSAGKNHKGVTLNVQKTVSFASPGRETPPRYYTTDDSEN